MKCEQLNHLPFSREPSKQCKQGAAVRVTTSEGKQRHFCQDHYSEWIEGFGVLGIQIAAEVESKLKIERL